MALVDFQLDHHVAVVSLNHGENRFNLSFVEALLEVMDDIEKNTEATTLVVRSSHEKIFSNGIDLPWFSQMIQQGKMPAAKSLLYQLNTLFKRLVTYPLITIAAITGHAFAAGAVFSSAFDFRFMRSDRGYFCLPEIDLGMPFLPGMNAILHSVVSESLLREMQLTGLRLTAEMCLSHNIVKGAFHIDQLMEQVLGFARQINKQRAIIKEMKVRLNQNIVHTIVVEDPPYIESGQYQFA